MWRFFCPLGINLTGTRIGTIVVSRSHHHARPARWCRARDRARGVRALLFAATATRDSDAPPEPGDADEGFPGETDRDARETRKQQRARRPAFVDDCDACAAAGYAIHDALAYQQARMRAKLGRDARLAEVTDRGEYAAAAVASACDSRGHWLRYAMRGVLDPETSSPFLVLSGPGHGLGRGARPDPAGRRPGRARSERGAQGAVRGGSRARRGRVLARRAFNDTDGQSSKAPADAEADADDDDSDSGVIIHIDRKEEHAAAFAYALCVDAARGEEGGGAETAVRGDRRPRRAAAVISAAARSGDDAKPFKSRLSKDRRRRRRRRRRRDERRRRPSVRFAEEVHGPPSGIRGGHAPPPRGAASEGLTPDGGLGAAGDAARAAVPRRRAPPPRRGATRSRGQPAALTGGSIGGGSIGGGSPAVGGERLSGPPPTRAARASRRAWRPPWPPTRRRRQRRRAGRRRRRRRRLAPRARWSPSTPGSTAGVSRARWSGTLAKRRILLFFNTATRTKTRRTKTKKRKPRSRRVSGTTPSRSARTSRACASPSPPRGAPLRARFDPAARLALADLLAASGDPGGRPSTSTPRRCTICPTTARSPQPRRRAPARRRRRRRTAWRGSAAP